MANPSTKMRQEEGKLGTLPTCKCPVGLLLWHLRQSGGKVLGRGLGSATQEAPCPQKAIYQSPSRCQTGPRSWESSASLNTYSQRCSSAEGQAKQGPVGRIGKSQHSPQSRRCPTPRREGSPVPSGLSIQCLLPLGVPLDVPERN